MNPSMPVNGHDYVSADRGGVSGARLPVSRAIAVANRLAVALSWWRVIACDRLRAMPEEIVPCPTAKT